MSSERPRGRHGVTTVEQHVHDIPAEHRGFYERLDALLRSRRPDVEVSISYGILKYARATADRGTVKLYLGVWRHGVSLYGWSAGAEAGFARRHPDLLSGRGTLKIKTSRAAQIADAEFLALFDAVLGTHSNRDGSPAPTRTTSG